LHILNMSMNKTEMISDYIDSQKLLSVAKLKNDFQYFDLVCQLSSIINYLHKELIQSASDDAEIQVLDKQIRNLYNNNLKNNEILSIFDKNINKITEFVNSCIKKYNLKLCNA